MKGATADPWESEEAAKQANNQKDGQQPAQFLQIRFLARLHGRPPFFALACAN